MRGFVGIMLAFFAFAIVMAGIGFLFAATADSSGVVRMLPLLAFFAMLTVGTVALVRKALK